MTPKHFAELVLEYEKQLRLRRGLSAPDGTLGDFARWLLANDTKVKPDDNGPETLR